MLLYYKVLFMIEIIIAELIFSYHLPKRKHFYLRIICSIIICLLIAYFFPIPDEFGYTWWYISIMFFLLFVCSFFAIYISFKLNFEAGLFVTIFGYTIQHLTYSIINLMTNAIGFFDFSNMYTKSPLDFSTFDTGTLIVCLIYLSIFILIYGITMIINHKNNEKNNNLTIRSNKVLLFSAGAFLTNIILNSIAVYSKTEKSSLILLNAFNILCCMLILYIQSSLIKENKMDIELANAKEAIKQSQIQYEIQKDNIELINIKCHDLKNQIGNYAQQGGLDEKTVSEMKDAINIYDSSIKTGNEVLNIVLTEKSLLCNKNKINLSCMVDASGLKDITEGDLYALFGNILDNAIEAVSQIKDIERRCIGLHVQSFQGFVSIMVDNYYEGKINFKNGLPITIKENKLNHGFGLKSIQLITEKYDGEMHINVEDNIFRLTLLFPNKNL